MYDKNCLILSAGHLWSRPSIVGRAISEESLEALQSEFQFGVDILALRERHAHDADRLRPMLFGHFAHTHEKSR